MAEKRNGPQMGPPGRHGGAPRGAKMMKLDKKQPSEYLINYSFKGTKQKSSPQPIKIGTRT